MPTAAGLCPSFLLKKLQRISLGIQGTVFYERDVDKARQLSECQSSIDRAPAFCSRLTARRSLSMNKF